MRPVSRRSYLLWLGSNALGFASRPKVHAGPVRQSTGPFEAAPVADATSLPPPFRSDDPNDFVQVRDGRFVLVGKPFVMKGTNYFGSWRFNPTIHAGNGIEHASAWAYLHHWDSEKAALDFQLIGSQLNATAIRTGTPSQSDFAALVQYHGFEPWFEPDGTVADTYRSKLIELADVAYASGIRMDGFYSSQVRSIALALRNHPGVIGYSIGNEVLINWPINGTHRSWYEPLAAGFILRRQQEVRAAAPQQLITLDEGAGSAVNEAGGWHAPGVDLATLPDIDDGTGTRAIRMADKVDYLGPHFYPEVMKPEDLSDGFAGKITDAKRQLAVYFQAARAIGKPVVVNEFGLPISSATIEEKQYAPIRDQFFEAIIGEAQQLGLQGALAWDAVPELAIRPGHYWLKEGQLNKSALVEVDIDANDHSRRRILFYDPRFNLFEWSEDGGSPGPTAAAKAIASAWPDRPQAAQR